MEDWYQQQDFFTQARMDTIKSWMNQEVVELFVYSVETTPCQLAI
jgi:hypothetical protein